MFIINIKPKEKLNKRVIKSYTAEPGWENYSTLFFFCQSLLLIASKGGWSGQKICRLPWATAMCLSSPRWQRQRLSLGSSISCFSMTFSCLPCLASLRCTAACRIMIICISTAAPHRGYIWTKSQHLGPSKELGPAASALNQAVSLHLSNRIKIM